MFLCTHVFLCPRVLVLMCPWARFPSICVGVTCAHLPALGLKVEAELNAVRLAHLWWV